MKKIECIIRDKKLADLEAALKSVGIHGMTVSEVKGFGNQQTRPDAYLYLPKTKVEIYSTDEELESIVEVILKVCYSGKPGDGKLAIFDVHDLVRIRTGERGEVAV